MKTSTSLPRVTLLALALVTVGATATFAQTSTTTTTPPPAGAKHEHGPGHGHMDFLTPAEQAQLKKAQDDVLATDADLKAESDALKAKHDALGANPSAEDKAAVHAEWKALMDKMRPAELKADPTLAPVFAKIDAHMKHGPAPASN